MQNASLFLDAARNLQHSSRVQTEFDSLESKVAQFIAVCERLRSENQELRHQLAAAHQDTKRLNEKIDGAKTRIEQLLARLPE